MDGLYLLVLGLQGGVVLPPAPAPAPGHLAAVAVTQQAAARDEGHTQDGRQEYLVR